MKKYGEFRVLVIQIICNIYSEKLKENKNKKIRYCDEVF